MSKRRFRLLEIEMIRHGVSLRHARRAALELECHHRELVEQALARGETPDQAEQGAHEALGSDSVLIARYASQKELRGWAYRLRAGYVLAPLLGSAGVSVAAMVLLIAIVKHLPPEVRHTRLPTALTHGIDFSVSMFFLWVIPVAIGFAFGALAIKQRIAVHWPVVGIVLLCMVTSLVNVEFVVSGGSRPGYVGAGIGFSTAKLPHELVHAAVTAALALALVGWLRHRARTSRSTLG